ncbi:hypothetical protein PM082_010157 [Marasmius tenuissimus]|nr:hypothetical protein PM082_010157 [Marasmius tenuissimus]
MNPYTRRRLVRKRYSRDDQPQTGYLTSLTPLSEFFVHVHSPPATAEKEQSKLGSSKARGFEFLAVVDAGTSYRLRRISITKKICGRRVGISCESRERVGRGAKWDG